MNSSRLNISLLHFLFLQLAMVFVPPNQVFGQHQIGIHVGANFGQLVGDAPSKVRYRVRTGFIGGLFYEKKVTYDVWVEVSLQYLQEGTRIQTKDIEKSKYVDSVKVHFNYLALPVNVKIFIPNQKLYFLGGLSVNYLLQAADNQSKGSVPEGTTRWNVTFDIGLGYHFKVGKRDLIPELRYKQGLINVNNDEEGFGVLFPRVKTQSWSLSIAYSIFSNKYAVQP